MRDYPATPTPRLLWASLSEGRRPQDGEVDSFAAKIWREAYRRGGGDWQEVEIGSPPHRKSMAAARAALAPGGMLTSDS